MLLRNGCYANGASGGVCMLVVWRIVERVGRRHRLAADAAGSGVCAAIAVIGCALDVVCAVMLRNLGRFSVPTVRADAAFIKVMFFDAGHRITAGAGNPERRGQRPHL